MHDKLFEGQQQWSGAIDPTEIFVSYAEDLELDVDDFRTAIREKSFDEKVEKGVSDGYEVGVTGTPTFFIDGERQRQVSYEALKNTIESKLND